ncbi:hypothetical protein H4582DRAFT_1942537 [Lactarius indigo]|nr:hypothetical protein H4582DRAFT_1942537 [Lactarius indigo]
MRVAAVRNSVIHSHYHTQIRVKTMSSTTPLHASLGDIRARIAATISARNLPGLTPKLVAVSKYKPASDIRASAALPRDLRWHFIGTVQSNKAKALAGIENLYAVQTLSSTKVADALNKHRAAAHAPLRVLVQINTSGEAAKGGVSPGPDADEGDGGEMVQLATHVVRACPRLHLVGLMTIGAAGAGDRDFAVLREARDQLVRALPADGVWGEDAEVGEDVWGCSREEVTVEYGHDIVRVGTGIFGARPQKKGGPDASAEQS